MGVEKVARKDEFRFWFKCIEIHNQRRHAWCLRLEGFWLFCRCPHLDKKRVWRARDGLRCPLLAPPSRGWGDRRLPVSGMHEANDKYSGPFDLKKRERGEERGETNPLNPLNRIDGVKANFLRECAGLRCGGWVRLAGVRECKVCSEKVCYSNSSRMHFLCPSTLKDYCNVFLSGQLME